MVRDFDEAGDLEEVAVPEEALAEEWAGAAASAEVSAGGPLTQPGEDGMDLPMVLLVPWTQRMRWRCSELKQMK